MPISAYFTGAADTVAKGVSALVPEKRADKHGNLVTRHVKLPSTLVGRTVVPAPTITRSAIAEGVIEGVMDTFASVVSGSKEWQDNEPRVAANLKNLPDSTLNFISTVLNRNEAYVSGIDCILISLLAIDTPAIEVDDAFFVFDGLKHRDKFNHVMRTDPDYMGGCKVGSELSGIMRGMSQYALDGFFYLPDEIPLRQQGELEQLKVQALFEASQALPEGSLDGVFSPEQRYTLRDVELAQILVDYPDETARVLELVKTREDLAVVREVMASDNRSLSEGII